MCGSQQTGKFLKRWEYQTTLSYLLRNLYAGQEATVRTGCGTRDWSQISKGVCQGCILSPCLFNLYAEYIMWIPGWMKHKLESRLLGEISTILDMICRWHHPYGRKRRGSKEPHDESERGEWKVGLKLNIQKTKIMASNPITSWQTDGGKVETLTDFMLGGRGSKITADGDWSHEIKTLAPWKKSYDQPRQHIKKQRHYFANKGPSRQSYGFSSSHVWM